MSMVNAQMLFNVNPKKFIDLCKSVNGNYREFVNALKKLPNFKVTEYMVERDFEDLYKLCIAKMI